MNDIITSYKKGVCFIRVPKVASQTVGRVLQSENGWRGLNAWEIKKSWDFIGLIRHPVERWLSGMAQFLQGELIDIDKAVANPIHDAHTEPQAWHFAKFKPKLFKFEEMGTMWGWLGITTDVHMNKRRHPKLFITQAHETSLISAYADDLKLWESAYV